MKPAPNESQLDLISYILLISAGLLVLFLAIGALWNARRVKEKTAGSYCFIRISVTVHT